MNPLTIAIAAAVLAIFVVVLMVVRTKEGHDEDDQLYLETKRKLQSEYERSAKLEEDLKGMKREMDWHNN